MKSSYKYRIYPTKSQESKLENTFSMCRHLYNRSLAERITSYQVWKYANNYTEGVSDTQRYKMIGNGFTVPVIEHILSHMDIIWLNNKRKVGE